jgi:hypothetical protein
VTVTCYPTPGKVKAVRLCDEFAQGVRAAGGTAHLMNGVPAWLDPGVAVFYGVTPQTQHLWQQARAEGRDWYYIDNSYFDATRGTHYRITRNAIQHQGIAASDGKRFAELGITVKPWRSGGEHVVMCLQSPVFMKTVAGIDQARWFDEIRDIVGNKQIRIRGWNGNKKQQTDTLHADLERAALLVTWSSAAAVTALLEGIPVLCGEQSAAFGVEVSQRQAWANSLADHQWTLAEIRDGTAWRALNGNQ